MSELKKKVSYVQAYEHKSFLTERVKYDKYVKNTNQTCKIR